MIVPAMTTEEVRHELLYDLTNISRRIPVQAKLFFSEMKRKHLGQEVHTYKFQSHRRIEWTILMRLHPTGVQHAFYTETTDTHGKVAYQFSRVGNTFDTGIIKYNPHFFTRYRERCQPDITRPSDVIRYFFKHNFECVAGQTELLPDHTTLINYVFTEGMGIGWNNPDKKVVHMKTFLPHHLLNKKQQSLADYIRHHEDGEEFKIHIRPENQKNKI